MCFWKLGNRCIGSFVPWDVLSFETCCPWDVLPLGRVVLGTFCPWDVLSLGTCCPWDVLSLGHFVPGTFCLCTVFIVFSYSLVRVYSLTPPPPREPQSSPVLYTHLMKSAKQRRRHLPFPHIYSYAMDQTLYSTTCRESESIYFLRGIFWKVPI